MDIFLFTLCAACSVLTAEISLAYLNLDQLAAIVRSGWEFNVHLGIT